MEYTPNRKHAASGPDLSPGVPALTVQKLELSQEAA